MGRKLVVAVAQLGPIARDEAREAVVRRLVLLLEQAAARGAGLVVFPELALTTFFPRWWIEDEAELDRWFEQEMPGPVTAPLFDRAGQLGIAFCLGFAELAFEKGSKRRFNTQILVEPDGRIALKYRKVHLPGHAAHEPWRPFQHLEKGYFTPGDLGFVTAEVLGGRIGMLICNDRRWPEAWRCLGLQATELVTLGYNTPWHYPPVPQHDHLQNFHNHLVMQASAYQNGLWVAAAAKCGVEEGCLMIGQSCIIAPTGEIVAMATTLGDEVITAECDFDRCAEIRDHIFNFRLHRRPEHYGRITEGRL